jgi:hypothetical protein
MVGKRSSSVLVVWPFGSSIMFHHLIWFMTFEIYIWPFCLVQVEMKLFVPWVLASGFIIWYFDMVTTFEIYIFPFCLVPVEMKNNFHINDNQVQKIIRFYFFLCRWFKCFPNINIAPPKVISRSWIFSCWHVFFLHLLKYAVKEESRIIILLYNTLIYKFCY